jgi:hypothetical protein
MAGPEADGWLQQNPIDSQLRGLRAAQLNMQRAGTKAEKAKMPTELD